MNNTSQDWFSFALKCEEKSKWLLPGDSARAMLLRERDFALEQAAKLEQMEKEEKHEQD